jgi:zinc protease
VADDPLSLIPQRTLVDGVPVYWSPYDGQPIITIVFRVGRVDEDFGQMGITHVVEHLTLNALRGASYAFNGQVTPTTTSFTATGSPDELVAFAGSVCASLRSLPLDRLRHELGVLVVEAQGRAADLASQLLSLHCGYTPHGRGHLPEYGLSRLRESDVATWAAERFTKENAVVWLAGQVPATLSLDLPAGRRMSCPEPTRIPALQPPSYVTGPPNMVGLSGLTPWSLPLRTAALVAGQRLREKLRFEHGISYRTRGDADLVSSRTAHLLVLADCIESVQEKAAKVLTDVMSELARTGRVDDDLPRVIDAMRRAFASPQAVPQILHGWASGELAGHEVRSLSAAFEAMERVRPDEVAAAATAALKSSLLLVPQGCSPEIPAFPPQRRETAAIVSGQKFRHCTAAAFNFGAQRNYVVLGETGVSRVDDRGEVSTVLFKSCAALLKWEGRRIVIGEDRQTVSLKAQDWRNGSELVAWLDAAIPEDRTVLTVISD